MSEPTDFWRKVRAVASEVAGSALQPTGVVPGAYRWGTVDRYGRVLHASQGVGALVYADSVQTITNDTDTNVSFDLSNAAAYNFGDVFDPGAPTRLTVPIAGYYQTWGHAVWSAGSTGYRSVTLKQFDASNVLQRFIAQSTVAPPPTVTCAHDAHHPGIYIEAGHYVTFVVRHTQGSDRDIQVSTAFALIQVG